MWTLDRVREESALVQAVIARSTPGRTKPLITRDAVDYSLLLVAHEQALLKIERLQQQLWDVGVREYEA